MSCMLPHKLLYLTSEDGDDGMNNKKLNTNISYHHYNQENDFDNEKSIDSNDDKAFDDVVFDILKVDPEDIASQLTLIDLPLFKKIQPEELTSCKWMSRDKHSKAPNIVAFIKRFNQTTFWVQKEILVCKRLERRAKMITHFIKIVKRLNEMQNFNSVMAIISGLKSAPIERLKKTWNLISKSDMKYFERIWRVMLDTTDNQRKLRDLHTNCKLPVIPFLGLYLTDLIHIDIAHPHNCFDNPQRRNQMNNICRILSDYQQSTYERLIEISYVKNYLNSFVYFEEFQKFKEDENYRDSLELEPDNENATTTATTTTSNSGNLSPSLTPINRHATSTPINEKYIQMQLDKPALVAATTAISDDKTKLNRSLTLTNNDLIKTSGVGQLSSSSQSSSTTSTNSITTTSINNKIVNNINNGTSSLSCMPGKHRKTLSLAFNNKDNNNHELGGKNSHSFANCDQTVKHPLDDSIIEDPSNTDNYIKIQDSSLIKDLFKKNKYLLNEMNNTDNIDGKLGGRNIISDLKTTNDDSDCTNTTNDNCLLNVNKNTNQNSTITFETNSALSLNSNSNSDKLKRAYEEKLLTQLTNEQKIYIIDYQTAMALCYFESTVKRKCILKNGQKPHFSQWHSYWLQLVGNVLFYYSSKINLLPTSITTTATNSVNTLNQASSCNSVNSDSITNEQFYQNQQLERKHYHKDPCKMHPIANWMVVALFQDDCSLLSTTANQNNNSSSNSSNCSNTSRNSSNHSTTTSSTKTTCISVQKKKYDIQVTDLTKSTIYKFRFNNYKLAKEWHAHFKLAINLHERLKPENLIKFD